jgi:EAL domain-containing protein (putative c-di-GMP-specific phosphodiesterase class I)
LHLSLDDFGTGYSSLAYLKRFPLSSVKIDRAFVTDITTNTGDAAIAKAIIAMGHSLQLNVIAEGVETAEQLQLLRKSGCDQIQGFYFSRPVTADEFGGMLRARKSIREI